MIADEPGFISNKRPRPPRRLTTEVSSKGNLCLNINNENNDGILVIFLKRDFPYLHCQSNGN